MRAMPFGRARVRHRLHDLILRRQRRGAALGLRAHRAEGIEPIAARLSAAARNRGILVRWIKQPNGRKATERDIVWSEKPGGHE